MLSDDAACEVLGHWRHALRFWEVLVGNVGEFGDPALDKGAGRVVVGGLFAGRVDADGVDACGSGLHLEL